MLDECIKQLRMLRALPPYDVSSNICAHDGYFADSINRRFTKEILEQAHKVIDDEQKRYNRMRSRFMAPRG